MRIPLELSKWTASLPCRYEHGAFHLDTQSDLWDGCVGDLFLCGAGHPSRVLLTSPAIVGTVSTAISKKGRTVVNRTGVCVSPKSAGLRRRS